MSATDKTKGIFAGRKMALTSVAAVVLMAAPHVAAAQGLDRLFNRAAGTEEATDAEMTTPSTDWGLEVTNEESVDPTRPSITNDVATQDALLLGQEPIPAVPSAPAIVATPESDPLREMLDKEIDARMRAIAKRVGETQPAPESDSLTVEELDALQRDAQRSAAAQTLRESEYDSMRSEIEMLLYLQNTVTELREAQAIPEQQAASQQAAAEPAAPAVDVEALRAQWEAEQAAAAATREEEQRNAALAAEQAAIPRLASIKGAAGLWEAEIESVRGVLQFVVPGDALADGFSVESIDAKGAVIKAVASGNRYSLIPSPPSSGTDAPTAAAPAMAQDLAQTGGVF